MKNVLKFGIKQYASYHLKQWDKTVKRPDLFQQKIFQQLLQQASNTVFGKEHQFKNINSYAGFCEAVPLRTYEEFLPYIEKIKRGAKNVLFPGQPKYFAQSSGTTSKVKFIPVHDAYTKTYSKSGLHLIFSYMRATGNYDIVLGDNLLIQGSPLLDDVNGIKAGRMSGISYHIMPPLLKRKQLPSYETNILADWEQKVQGIVKESSTADLRILGGIPPWVLMYFDYLTEHTKEQLIKDVFPNLQLYIHGGVNVEPYRQFIYDKIGKPIHMLDTYTASEGFLGFQEELENPEMTICSNNGIFYEFVKLSDYLRNPKTPKRCKLTAVEKNIDYVVVLNTMSGLWGYVIGDTIRFTNKYPFRFEISGRVSQFTSLFGEHIIASEVQHALEQAIKQFGLRIRAFTVAPQLLTPSCQSHHEWWIEFEKWPGDLEPIATLIDRKMQEQNCAYADLIKGKVIAPLKIIPVASKGFEKCFLKENKIDGQSKIPVLANNRKLINLLRPYQIMEHKVY